MCGALQRGWGCGGRGWGLSPLLPPSTQYPRSAWFLRSGSTSRHHHGYTSQKENVSVAFCRENVSDSVGFGSRCYESCRPTHDVYFQSFEQRERFASPTNTQNSSAVPRLNYKPFAEAKPADLRRATQMVKRR